MDCVSLTLLRLDFKLELMPEEIVEEQPQVGFLEKLKIHKFKILAGVLGILVFVGAVVGAYKFGQRQIQPIPVPTITPTPIITITPSPKTTSIPLPTPTEAKKMRIPRELISTSNWITKTYPNLFVSFKVPPIWSGGIEKKANYENLLRRVSFDDPDWYGSDDFAVFLYNNPQNLSRREFWWQEIIKGEPPFSKYGAQYVQNILEWTIGGKEALSLFYTEYSMGGTYLMISRDNQMIVIFFNGDLLKENRFETILSTFKFLE